MCKENEEQVHRRNVRPTAANALYDWISESVSERASERADARMNKRGNNNKKIDSLEYKSLCETHWQTYSYMADSLRNANE